MFDIERSLENLFDQKNAPILTGIMRGAERECLRTTNNGKLALTPHPEQLGSALTHPQITTDFSEALLEFITPPSHRICDLFSNLDCIQKYTLENIGDELLWTSSMPCCLGKDEDIPVAQYGHSNNGLMKTIYRVGLGHRYGRSMQTVSGIHYNFSLPDSFWAYLAREENSLLDLQSYKTQGYFGLVRNFRRHYWLLIYLFGASPALCASFVENRAHNLLDLHGDGKSLYLPYATSLRMGDLGYQSSAQEALFICYNELNSYLKTLCTAIASPHKHYEDIGVKDGEGNYKQLNTGLLQIENEFYSPIRPKRAAYPGETALAALDNRGVEYIEVRCLDIDPFEPLGLNREQVQFLDTFLVYCTLKDSPMSDFEESDKILSNQKKVVNEGRKPGLKLEHPEKGAIALEEWANQLLRSMQPVAELLDRAHGKQSTAYQESLEAQTPKISNSALTPSGRLVKELKDRQINFSDLMTEYSQTHKNNLMSETLPETLKRRQEEMALESLAEQKAVEQKNSGHFDQFLANYYQQYKGCS